MSDFRVFSLQATHIGGIKENGGYRHAVAGATLHIEKGGVKIVLGEDEIKQLVQCVGANFRR